MIKHRIKVLIKDIGDYVEYKRAFVPMNSPEAAELNRAWHDAKVRVRDAGRPGGRNSE